MASTQPLIQRVVDLIQNRYADPLTLRRLATAVGTHPGYLGRLFRMEMGMTAREYLTRVRLEYASALIDQGVKIEAVTLFVGYRSKKNFYRNFKRHFGTTPQQYRLRASRTVA